MENFTWPSARVCLQMPYVLDCQLDDLVLLDPAAALALVTGGHQASQVGQTAVHTIPPALLDDPV